MSNDQGSGPKIDPCGTSVVLSYDYYVKLHFWIRTSLKLI